MPSIPRRTLAALATTLALIAGTAPAASATSTIVGPPALSVSTSGTNYDSLMTNLTADGSASYAVPSDGTITGFSANLLCSTTCSVRLVVLRDVATAPTYQVVSASASESGSTGIASFSTSLPVFAGDLLALELGTSSGVRMATQAGATNRARFNGIGTPGGSFTFDDTFPGNVFLFNAELIPPVGTTVTVDVPGSVNAGESVDYQVHVDRVTGSDRSGISGSVSLTENGAPIAACQSLPVTAGEATCTTTAGSTAGRHEIEATYSGNGSFSSGSGSGHVNVKVATTTTVSATPDRVDAGAAIVFSATVTPPPSAVYVAFAPAVDRGTVAFRVDGEAVATCAAQPVDGTTGVATCTTTAPTQGVIHTITVDYSGGTFYGPSGGNSSFRLTTPALSAPATVDAGTVAVGKAGTAARVTVTSSGTRAARITSAVVAGADFAIVGDTCSGSSLAPAATCTVDVSFTPAAAGTRTATLTIASDAKAVTVALTGQGVLPAPVVPPTPPLTGARVASTQAATLIAGAASAAIKLPLLCPVVQPCTVSGTLTVVTTLGTASAAKTKVATIARFSGVRIEGGKTKAIKLKLDRAIVKRAQQRGVRRLKATLTLVTRVGGQRITTEESLTLRIPKARTKAKASPKFTG